MSLEERVEAYAQRLAETRGISIDEARALARARAQRPTPTDATQQQPERSATGLPPLLQVYRHLHAEDCAYDAKARLVGLALGGMLNAEDGGTLAAWPSVKRLSRMTDLSEPSVERALRSLKTGVGGAPPLYLQSWPGRTRRSGHWHPHDTPRYTLNDRAVRFEWPIRMPKAKRRARDRGTRPITVMAGRDQVDPVGRSR